MQGQVAKSVLAQLGYARLLNGGLRGGANQGLGMLSGSSSSGRHGAWDRYVSVAA
jgi:hypothetical protein